jgi:hypothetical protein
MYALLNTGAAFAATPFMAPSMMYYAVVLMKLWRGNPDQFRMVQGSRYWVGIIGFPAIGAGVLYAALFVLTALSKAPDIDEALLKVGLITLSFYLYWVLFGWLVKRAASKTTPASPITSPGPGANA